MGFETEGLREADKAKSVAGQEKAQKLGKKREQRSVSEKGKQARKRAA